MDIPPFLPKVINSKHAPSRWRSLFSGVKLNMMLAFGCAEGIVLIKVKEEGWTWFSKGLQGCSEGFPEGEARGKSRGAALPALGKPRPTRLFYWDLHLFRIGHFDDISILLKY